MIKVEVKNTYYIEEEVLKTDYNDYVDDINNWNEDHPDSPDEIPSFEEWVKTYVEEEDLYWTTFFNERTVEKVTFNVEEPF